MPGQELKTAALYRTSVSGIPAWLRSVRSTLATVAALATLGVAAVGARLLAGDAVPAGLATLGAAALVAAPSGLDDPTTVAERVGGEVRSGPVRATGDPVPDPGTGEPVDAYLYRAANTDSRGETVPGYEAPADVGTGLAASGPVVVEADAGRVSLDPSTPVDPLFDGARSIMSANLADAVGDPEAYLDRLGLDNPAIGGLLSLDNPVSSVSVAALSTGDAVTVVGEFDADGEPRGPVGVRAESAAAWRERTSQDARAARLTARLLAPTGAVLLLVGLALSLV